MQGHAKCLQMLISENVDINLADRFGCTAAIWAAANGHDDCLSILIFNGADISKKNNKGQTALTLSKNWSTTSILRKALNKNKILSLF